LKKKVIIIGAGISGLTAAFKLKQAGLNVVVYEKSENTGGNVRTEKVAKELIEDESFDGLIFDQGPNSGLETTPLIQELCESLGIADRKIYGNTSSNKRYIMRRGKLHELAMSPKFLISGLFSISAKLRLIKEPFIKTKSHPKETLAEFTTRRLGREFLDYAINPFVAGVFAGDPSNLNVKTAFPKLYELEQNYGSLIGGSIKSARERKKRAEKSKQSAKTFSFKDGMHELTDALANELKDEIRTGCEVLYFDKTKNGYDVTYRKGVEVFKESSDGIILSVPAYAAAEMLRGADNNLSGQLAKIYYPPVNVAFMIYKKKNVGFDLDGFGYLIPEKEKRNILGSLWNSVIFDDRAPANYVTFTNFIGGARSPELTEFNDASTLSMVKEELHSVLELKSQPEYYKIVRWQKAIPQYHRDYDEVYEAIEKFHDRHPDFRLCSNYYGGISIADCIKSAYEAARMLSLKFN
jgi:oxygen-dependent protoporphyrinogen oxidase